RCIARTRARSSGEYSRRPPADRVGCNSPYRRSQARSNSGLTPERRLSSPIRTAPALSIPANIQHLYRSLTMATIGDTVPAVQNLYRRWTTMKKLDLLAATLVLVGGLNWGLVAVAKFDLVAWIFGTEFGETNAASRIVYGLVGLAAVYGIGSLLASV